MTVGKRSGRRVYTGKVIDLDVDLVEFPNGSTGELELFRHPGASAIVPFLGDPQDPDPQILLIKQYRYAADGYLYEIPAGRLDPGEAPEACAHRELREETGCAATEMRHLYTMYTTPGFTDERIHIFLATGLTQGDTAHEADEFLTVEPVRLAKALEMIHSGEIKDGKTTVGILFAASAIPSGARDLHADGQVQIPRSARDDNGRCRSLASLGMTKGGTSTPPTCVKWGTRTPSVSLSYVANRGQRG